MYLSLKLSFVHQLLNVYVDQIILTVTVHDEEMYFMHCFMTWILIIIQFLLNLVRFCRHD